MRQPNVFEINAMIESEIDWCTQETIRLTKLDNKRIERESIEATAHTANRRPW